MANTGLYPADFTTALGQVRLLIGDTDPLSVSGSTGTYRYFSDDEITGFLALTGGEPRLAAARALETIASSQALMLKSWSTDDLTVRGEAIAESLRKLAKQLRDEVVASESSEFFEIIRFTHCDGCEEYAECRVCGW